VPFGEGRSRAQHIVKRAKQFNMPVDVVRDMILAGELDAYGG
jgi:hypothetical protein